MSKNNLSLKVVLLTDEIMDYFTEVVEGMASDLAYYELLTMVESYILKEIKKEDLIEYTSFTFGIEDVDFDKVEAKYRKSEDDWNKLLGGEEIE